MVSSKRNVGWGIMLICLGVMAFVQDVSSLPEWTPAAVLGVGGMIAFAVFLTEMSDWVLLIPVYVMWAVAGIIGYALWGDTDGNVFPSVVLFLVAFPFLVTAFRDKSQWWALIPAYAILCIIPIILFERDFQGEYVAMYVMTAIALPFWYVYFRNRGHWWALIPGYVLVAVGLMIGLIGAGTLDGLLVPAYIMLATAIPFLYVYYRNRSHWWALIPGGITGVMGLGFLISESAIEYVGPVLMIAAGAWLLWRQYRN